MKWRIFPEINSRSVGLRRGKRVVPATVMALLIHGGVRVGGHAARLSQRM
jgi:hypothetical protein